VRHQRQRAVGPGPVDRAVARDLAELDELLVAALAVGGCRLLLLALPGRVVPEPIVVRVGRPRPCAALGEGAELGLAAGVRISTSSL
jgi:hypothetical protein